MTNSLFISTTEAGSGKALVSLGIIDCCCGAPPKVHFFRPLIQPSEKLSPSPDGISRDEDIDLMVSHFDLKQTYEESYGLLLRGGQRPDRAAPPGRGDRHHHQQVKALEGRGDFLLCEGSDYLGESSAFEFSFNQEIAKNLGAPVLILGNALGRSLGEAISPIQMAVDAFQERGCDIAGMILNNADPEQGGTAQARTLSEFWLSGTIAVGDPHQMNAWAVPACATSPPN
jgi:phosphate acetyltransferase